MDANSSRSGVGTALKYSALVAIGLALGAAGSVWASRDASGTYTLSPSTPFVTGTAISSSAVNTRFADIATELTDSFSRSGKGPMLAPLKLYSGGNATAPELVWNDDTNSGFYLIGEDNVGLSLAGTKRWDFGTAGSTLTGTLGVSGVATFSAGLSTHAAISPPLSGDAVVVRTAAPTTGLVQLGNAATENVAFDGTRYLHGSTDKPVKVGTALAATDAANKGYVDAVPRFVVAGYVRGSDGVILSQTGSLTASAVRSNPGEYTITVAGLTTSAIVVATSVSATTPAAAFVVPGTGSFTVQNQAIATHSAQDGDITFAVLKL
jgi:hypothetical protein